MRIYEKYWPMNLLKNLPRNFIVISLFGLKKVVSLLDHRVIGLSSRMQRIEDVRRYL